MNDDELLRGYRAAGPPPDLRARIERSAKASAERACLRDWLPAIAAAALIAMFSALSYRLHADLEARLFVPDELQPVEQWIPDDPGGLH
jgi:hypothetical protein